MADNLDTLIRSGVLREKCRDDLTEEDIEAINCLSEAEITHIISAGRKLGADFFKRHASHCIYF